MTQNNNSTVLFSVIRSAFGLSATIPEITDEDFRCLMFLGKHQSILPIIAEGLSKQSSHATWEEELKMDRLRYARRYIIRDHLLQLLYCCLDDARIPYIPLKGAVLQNLYPEPWMRTSSDIDILVHEDDLDRAVAAIEAGTDFKFDKRNYHDVTMLSPQLCLELHFSIKEHMENIDPLLECVWDYTKQLESGYCCTLTPEFQIFHVLAHMSYHMVNGGLGIRPFLDLWLLREKTEYDKDILCSMLEKCRILQFYQVSCQLLDVWLNHGSHTAVTEKLEQYCLSGGVFGSSDNGARQRKYQGLSYLVRRLFISRSVLGDMYPELKERSYLLPFYQIKRWTRLTDIQKRKSAMAEAKQLRSVSIEKIESFDWLLSHMGL